MVSYLLKKSIAALRERYLLSRPRTRSAASCAIPSSCSSSTASACVVSANEYGLMMAPERERVCEGNKVLYLYEYENEYENKYQ